MSFKRLLIISAAAVAAAGCATDPHRTIGQDDLAMGEAVKYNAALQTINPDPVYPEGGAEPGDNGDKGAQAVKRFRQDQVGMRHKTEAQSATSSGLSTTQSQSGSGGGGPR